MISHEYRSHMIGRGLQVKLAAYNRQTALMSGKSASVSDPDEWARLDKVISHAKRVLKKYVRP